MNNSCPEPRLLLDAVQEGRGHLWADHLAQCPRCRMLVLSHKAFVKDALAEANSQGSRGDDAVAAARLDAVIGNLGAGKAQARRPMWWLPLAAVFLVAIGLWSMVPELGHNHGSVIPADGNSGLQMRGGESATTWAAPVVVGGSQHPTVSWSELPGAQSYRVDVLAPDLSLIHSFNAGPDTSLVVDSSAVMARAVGGFVVVKALKDDQVVGATQPVALPRK